MSRKRRRQNQESDIERRAVRAHSLVQLGELSSRMQALEGGAIASGSNQALLELTNPQRRPPRPREPLPEDLVTFLPTRRFELDEIKFCHNLRSLRERR